MNSRDSQAKPADKAREPVSEIGDRERELGRVAEALGRR